MSSKIVLSLTLELFNFRMDSCDHFCRMIDSSWCCSVAQSCPTLRDPMDCRTPDLPVPHHLPEFAQVHVHCIDDAIQSSHPLTPSSLSAFNLSQHQGLFQWVVCLNQVSKILELLLQHQFSLWVFRVYFKIDWFDACCQYSLIFILW